MKTFSPRHLLTASALAVTVGLGFAAAQDAQPDISPEASQQAQEAANNNEPLTAPETASSQVMPDSFADLVQQVAPAVVNITTTAVVAQPTGGEGAPIFPEGSPFSDLFRDFGFPGIPGQPGPGGPRMPQRSNALGSGFVISADGFIVTNNHVIEGADEIEIEFYSGETLPAKVVGTDPNTDVALLKVESSDPLPFVEFGNSDEARVGDWVLALGNPLGQGFSASSGIVSARNRELSGTYDDYLQTDAAINRGNSGGPLFNLKGEVVGVNTAILSPNGGSIGIGFSMASNVVSSVVKQLQEFGETRRGWLGVKIQDVTPDMAEALGLAAESGAMVTDVPEGPAREAGMRAGDVITSFDGSEVKDTRSLVRRVAEAPSGEPVDVVVQRSDGPVTLSVTLGRRETAEGAGDRPGGSESSPSQQDVLGMTLSVLTPQMAQDMGLPNDARGLVVQEVDPSSEAAEKGLAPGDIITEAGQQPVASIGDLNARIDEAREAGRKSLLVLVRRAGEPRFVALPVGES
ncbi:putative periplasmic serine endoprotease DegP-like precursor [Paracoccus haematequi]|uniref:Probable periplasmic serine endoprotease DegP-like n=1 Tax=Paracoccus haematequi TaxID=2491866 RepID=A0A447IR17_9RHOB|nr:Do family serine endopeptidase [Paracoccus haematequi]VDS09921.1 putative periplasmic serine endoprotease DegP-like precursor [Paracoccus haematequi]